MPQAPDPSAIAALAHLFKGGPAMQLPPPSAMGSPMPGSPTAGAATGATPTAQPAPDVLGVHDSSADSSAEGAQHPGVDSGLLGALKNLIQFFSAKPGSGSTDDKYEKDLEDAGMAKADTGIGK